MRKLFILAMCLAIKAHSQLKVFPDRVEIDATDRVMIKINGIEAVVVTGDSIIISSLTGTGIRHVTAKANGRISTPVSSSTVPTEGTVNIPAVAFSSSRFTNVPVYDFLRGSVYFNSGMSEMLKAAVVLPDKANISTVNVNLLDNSATMNIRVTLYRIGINANRADVLAVAKSGGAIGVQSLNLSVNSLLINNSNYQYFMLVEAIDQLGMPGKWQGEGLSIKNVIINYQY